MPMFKTLYAKLSLSLILLLMLVAVFYALLTVSTFSYSQQKIGQQLNLNLAKNMVADRQLVIGGKVDEKAISTTFMEYMVINPSIELYLLDRHGKILSYSADPGQVKRKSVSMEPIRAFLEGETLPLLGDDPRSHDRQKIFSVTPVPNSDHPEAYLYIVLLGEQYDSAEQIIKASLFWKHAGLALIGSLMVGLIIGLLLFRKLTRRLNTLSKTMENIAFKDFSRIDFAPQMDKQRDEIDSLNNAFTRMAIRIQDQLTELKQQNNLRRELVANVSHDLRTPVAILHGYLETLCLKDKQLTHDEKLQYVHMALLSSERLNHLINELFELAKLEAHETVPHKESFNLSELAYDVVQKFQLKAEKKQITLQLHTEDNAIFAHADIALIARVFENLIGNAVKFTPEQKTIEIHLTASGDLIITRIKDNGPGIAPEDLERIFDRFYQGDKNNNRSKPGGLGLAIAKRIMELHQGTIEVASQPGDGTEFTFALPATGV